MQFPKFTQKPSEPIHPGICLRQEPNHLLRFCLTCMNKTLQTRLCVTKDGREEKLEHWHTSLLPPFPCKFKDLNSNACLQGSFVPFKENYKPPERCLEHRMQALPHHHTALLAGDKGRWGIGATPSVGAGLSHYLFLSISKQLTLFNGCHLQGQPGLYGSVL